MRNGEFLLMLLLNMNANCFALHEINQSFLHKGRLKTYSSVYADKVLEATQTNQELPLIMPMDLKVSFYPNAADFSGQTIKWLKVFTHKALQDPRYVIEVRLSNENLLLQQKRLFVIQKILANSGLSSHQLVVDYVKRPKDILVLRMVKKEPNVGLPSRTKKEKVDKKVIREFYSLLFTANSKSFYQKSYAVMVAYNPYEIDEYAKSKKIAG